MNAILTLFLVLSLLVPVFVANAAERTPDLRLILKLVLSVITLLLVLVGFASLLIYTFSGKLVTPSGTGEITSDDAQNAIRVFENMRLDIGGMAVLAAAALSLLVWSHSVRVALARLIPIHPDSQVHFAALVLVIVCFGLNIYQFMLTTPEVIEQAVSQQNVQVQAGYLDILIAPLFAFTAAGVFGVGAFTRRNWREVAARLGLKMLTPAHLLLVLVTTALLVVMALGVDTFWARYDPITAERIGKFSQALMGGFTGILGALAIGLCAGIGEEVFFRGALQPRLGLLIQAALFASFHTQYTISIATLYIFIIGLILGVLRNKTSLTVCILVHTLYNFTLVMLGN